MMTLPIVMSHLHPIIDLITHVILANLQETIALIVEKGIRIIHTLRAAVAPMTVNFLSPEKQEPS